MKEFTDENHKDLHEQANGEGVNVIKIWATWCGPCKLLGPVLEKVEEDCEEGVNFFSIDADKFPNYPSILNITTLPTVIIIVDGVIEESITGLSPVSVYKEAILKHTNKE